MCISVNKPRSYKNDYLVEPLQHCQLQARPCYHAQEEKVPCTVRYRVLADLLQSARKNNSAVLLSIKDLAKKNVVFHCGMLNPCLLQRERERERERESFGAYMHIGIFLSSSL